MEFLDSRDAAVVVEFNRCINSRSLAGLAALMTDDHTFIDTADTSITGKRECLLAWQGFFELFPDYQNIFEQIKSRDGQVTVMGRSSCRDPRLHGPALWSARVVDARIAEWRVHQDTPANRARLGFERTPGDAG